MSHSAAGVPAGGADPLVLSLGQEALNQIPWVAAEDQRVILTKKPKAAGNPSS